MNYWFFIVLVVIPNARLHELSKPPITSIDFEKGNFDYRNLVVVDWDKAYNKGMAIVNDPMDSSNMVCRMKIIPGYKRCEIREDEKLNIGEERWYSFKMYSPSKVDCDYIIIAQWKSRPDKGEAKRSPGLSIRDYGDSIKVFRCFNTKRIQTSNSRNKVLIGSFAHPKSGWNEFKVLLRPDPWGDGMIRIWMNDSIMVNYSGPFGYNDEQGLKCKLGAYNSKANCNYEIFFDDYISSDEPL